MPNKEYVVHSNRPPLTKIGTYGWRAPVNVRVRYMHTLGSMLTLRQMRNIKLHGEGYVIRLSV